MIRIATRGSALARWQAEHVASLLGGAELVVVDTIGDRDKATSLSALGGQGIFVKEVQAAVLDGRADLAVHSGKDLPSSAELQAPGLAIAAVPERADPRDALVGARLADIPPGGTIATGSARRRALLADLRPDLTFADLRGNMDTRLAKASEFAAVVVAVAALDRLGQADRITERLDVSVLVPQVAQGALAIEARPGTDAFAAVAELDHAPSRRAVDAERAWLAAIGGGCELPAGAHATVEGDEVTLTAILASFDGRIVLRDTVIGTDPVALGTELANQMLDRGGRWLLDG
ncbi:MAG: hydroxymethylbilane synthase [Actinomycetia bacterium]|nr:hydroxymethylbilane synthase [Actinomycetes bacterium]